MLLLTYKYLIKVCNYLTLNTQESTAISKNLNLNDQTTAKGSEVCNDLNLNDQTTADNMATSVWSKFLSAVSFIKSGFCFKPNKDDTGFMIYELPADNDNFKFSIKYKIDGVEFASREEFLSELRSRRSNKMLNSVDNLDKLAVVKRTDQNN